jgi:hypothetical protein
VPLAKHVRIKAITWNKEAVFKHIWSLFTNSGSLWVAWVHDSLLKGKSFWTIKIPQDCTWGWRTLLKLREEVRRFIKFEVVDGKKIYVWHPAGPLLLKYGPRVIYDADSQLQAKVDSMLQNQCWVWKPARSDDLVSIQGQLSLLELKNEDKAVRLASTSGEYSCANTFEDICEKDQVFDWWKLIWFPLSIPKHAFIRWLAIKNSLSTRDRLAQ